MQLPVTTQADRTFNILLQAIVTGKIAPGSRLREIELAKEMGIGRGPLREALNRLESRKLVTKVPHVGAQVVGLDLTEVIEIYQLRENLEGLACELAAKRMSQAQLDALARLIEQHAQYLSDNDGQLYIEQETDLDFHFLIIQGSQNSWLIRLLCDELYHRVRMYRFQSAHNRGRPMQALEDHKRILEALQQRDGELASMLMKRHISAARVLLEKY